MIAKKNPKADLEKKRFAFFQIGLIIAGASCLAAFEYSSATLNGQEQLVLQSDVVSLDPDPIFEVNMEQPRKRVETTVIDDIKVVDEVIIESKQQQMIDTDGPIVIDGDDDINTGDEFGYIEIEDNSIHPVAGIEPAYPGGNDEMARFISNNIELPDYIPSYDSGIVYVQFVVNKDGSIEQVGIRQGLSIEIDQAAIEVIKKMPNWTPGEQAGKPVRVRFTVPIQISLR